MTLLVIVMIHEVCYGCDDRLSQGYQKPAWLEALYTEKFFVGCSYHENAKKNEKNVCCLDCCTSICPHCLPSHRFHRLLQVRRYVYHDVVRLEDLQKLIDCSNVQVYLWLTHWTQIQLFLPQISEIEFTMVNKGLNCVVC